MNRRESLKAISGATLCGFLGRGALAEMQVERRPNIIVILADDAGYADFGFTGCEDIETPHLDSLAKEGVACTQGYVTASVCCPSRMGLITGRNQQRFGAECNVPVSPTPGHSEEDLGLETSEATIADLLKRSGYATMALGKWHLGELPQYHPNRRGFDEFYGFLGGGRSYWPRDLPPDSAERILRNHEPVDEQEDITYLTKDLTDAAIDFIEEKKDDPFFIYLAYNSPHAPLEAPKEYLQQFAGIKSRKRQTYLAMQKCMDDNIGRVLRKLAELDLKKDTLIFFLSDNGGTGWPSSNKPFRGNKGSYWEGGIRVPYIVCWPGHLPAGLKYDKAVSSLDILPTSLAAARSDAAPPKPLDGVNLLPYLAGEKAGDPHDMLFWRLWRVSACRSGKWKLLKVAENPLKKDRKLFYPLQLFNIEEDPYETRDLAGQHPEVVQELAKRLDDWDAKMEEPRWHDGSKWRKWQKVQVQGHRPSD